MRVLVLDKYFSDPPRDGGSRSLWDLRRSLDELGHECAISAQEAMLEPQSWDVVIVSRPVLAARVAERAKHAARRHTVYLGHDLHHQRLAAPDSVLPGQPRPAAAMAALERHCWSAYDLSLYPNHDEVAQARTTGADVRWFPYFRIDEVATAPGGHAPPDATSRSAPARKSETPRTLTLLFVGGDTHAPNVTGLRWFAAEILPVLVGAVPAPPGTPASDRRAAAVQALVVGRWQPEVRDVLVNAGLVFVGSLSDTELASVRRRAHANIAPLTAGAGLQSKVVEALASGIPLIATTTAMAGIPNK